MITFSLSGTDKELLQIIDLQKRNLAQHLSKEEIQNQGFVTVSHGLEDLQEMNTHEQNLLVKDDDWVAGYILAMTKNSRSAIPILVPMFEVFDKVKYKGQFISRYNYIVVGQVCIDKNYRGQGLFDKAYNAYREQFSKKYDFAITEIAASNQRSLNAHKRMGFTAIHTYIDADKIEWNVVVWDWK